MLLHIRILIFFTFVTLMQLKVEDGNSPILTKKRKDSSEILLELKVSPLLQGDNRTVLGQLD